MSGLRKDGLPWNGFPYRLGPRLGAVGEAIDKYVAGRGSADDSALEIWGLKAHAPLPLRGASARQALSAGYDVVKRPVGSAPIRDVVLAAAILSDGAHSTTALTSELL